MLYKVNLIVVIKLNFDWTTYSKEISLPIPPTIGMTIGINENGTSYTVGQITIPWMSDPVLTCTTNPYKDLDKVQSTCQELIDAGFVNTHLYTSSPPDWSIS